MKRKLLCCVATFLMMVTISGLFTGCKTNGDDVSLKSDVGEPNFETGRFGTMVGSTSETFIIENYPNANLSTYQSAADSFAALSSNKVDYVLSAYTICLNATRVDKSLMICKENLKPQDVAMAVKKGNTELLSKIDAVISKYKKDGTLDDMHKRWIIEDGNYKPLDIPKAEGKNGTLRVALSSLQEPVTFMFNGKYSGLSCELIERIALELDIKIVYQDMQFAGIIASLESGKSDIICTDLAVTEERKQTVDFSVPFYNEPITMICRKDMAGMTAVGKVYEDANDNGFINKLSESFKRTFITEDRWKLVLDGLYITVIISIISGIFGTIVGFAICMLRRSSWRIVSVPTSLFIRIIQGTPVVVLLMILYYVVFGKMDISAIIVSILCFSFNFGVYVSEMMRTGIDAVDNGQIEAAAALGFTKLKIFFKITFPQAARHFLPVFKGEFISMVKMTSVVGYIAIQDLTKVSDIIRSRTLEAFFPLIATAIIYFIVANVLTMILSKIEIGLDTKRRVRKVKGVVIK